MQKPGMGKATVPSVVGPRGQSPALWQGLVDGSACPICRQGEALDVVADLSASWATAPSEAPLLWYVCVVAKKHVVEPFELAEPDRSNFWKDVLLVAQRLQQASAAVKVNYEIHGNTLPHLHCHILPLVHHGDLTIEARPMVNRTQNQIAELARAIRTSVPR